VAQWEPGSGISLTYFRHHGHTVSPLSAFPSANLEIVIRA
jgi:hypothetical protein